MSKLNVFKKGLPQHQILYQNPGQGYTALFQIISCRHLTLGKYPHLFIQAPPVQLIGETLLNILNITTTSSTAEPS